MDALEDTQSSLGVCCCCLAEGSYKDMMRPYTWIGQDEIYSTMLIDCFGIDITSLEVAPWLDSKRLICELCIARLREASSFKTQVEQAQKTYVDRLKTFNFRDITKPDLMAPAVKLEQLDDSEVDHYNDLVDDFAVDDDMSDILPAVTSQNLFTDAAKPKRRDKDRHSPSKIKRRKKRGSIEERERIKKLLREPRKLSPEDTTSSSIAKMDISTMLDFTNLCPFEWVKNRYSCFVCKERFVSHGEFKVHMQEHEKGSYKRRLGSIRYSSRIKIDITDIKCKVCDLNLDDFETLKAHLQTQHSKILHDQSHALLLLFRFDKDKKLLCRVCGEMFYNFQMLYNHMNVHYRNCICETCGKSFVSKQRLKVHIKLHTVSEYPCKLCKEVFNMEGQRKRHLIRIHGKGGYTCQHCKMKFRSYRTRHKHLAEVHNEARREFGCTLCPKVFKSAQSLASHHGRLHLNVRNVACSECQATFYSNQDLKDHMVTHFGARIHECTVCHKTFLRRKTLIQHMRIHTNERFYCPVCGKSFTQKGTMKGHMKVHENRDVDSVTVNANV